MTDNPKPTDVVVNQMTPESLKQISIGSVIKNIILPKIKINPDIITTVAGTLIGGGILTKVDYDKVLSGDTGEIANIVIAGAVWLWGFFTNKKPKI